MIDVRVIRLWVVPSYKDTQIANSVEMILRDKKVHFGFIYFLVYNNTVSLFMGRLIIYFASVFL